MTRTCDQLLDSDNPSIFDLRTNSLGPQGSLPLTEEMLLNSASGDMFGLSQNAGMGWDPAQLLRKQFLILGTQGGIRAEDGRPIALGYHTGHWEVGLLMRAAAEQLDKLERLPFAAFVSDPCDGRTQGTVGMMDSLPYRNDAATVFRRLIRSLPLRSGLIGVATCDKGLPATMIAIASCGRLPGVLVPGGVTLPPTVGEDAGKIQSIGARFAHGEITLKEAAEAGCHACASPGGGCQFLGTAATSQVVAEALGMSLPHAALAPSGQTIWLDMARRSATAVVRLEEAGIKMQDILTPAAVLNAMTVHAAFGGSTNLLLHLPAVAFAAGLARPTSADWSRVNRKVPRIVDVLPNGPVGHPTVRVFLAGGVPEVMLHLRRLGLLELGALTVSGKTVGENLDWWEKSERRARLREILKERDGIDPDDVVMSPEAARRRGLTSTVTFPVGNLAPEGSVIKSTAIDPSVVGSDGVYRKVGPARVFASEREAIAAIKGRSPKPIQPGDIIVLICRGPMGSGMEEIYQITSALKFLKFGKHVAVITDARFSGVSTGACIGHVGPEALAGGPIGKVRDGDLIEIVIDRNQLTGSINFVGTPAERLSPEAGAKVLASRQPAVELKSDPDLPADTRLWALLQHASGGTWGGCVYDVDRIEKVLRAGLQALDHDAHNGHGSPYAGPPGRRCVERHLTDSEEAPAWKAGPRKMGGSRPSPTFPLPGRSVIVNE
jgi:putative YjhG/YagF family dehydratase